MKLALSCILSAKFIILDDFIDIIYRYSLFLYFLWKMMTFKLFEVE